MQPWLLTRLLLRPPAAAAVAAITVAAAAAVRDLQRCKPSNFWTTSYKAIPGKSLPMYYATSDQKSKITFSNNRMTLDGARFALARPIQNPLPAATVKPMVPLT